MREVCFVHHMGMSCCNEDLYIGDPSLGLAFRAKERAAASKDLETFCKGCELVSFGELGEGEVAICFQIATSGVDSETRRVKVNGRLLKPEDYFFTRVQHTVYAYTAGGGAVERRVLGLPQQPSVVRMLDMNAARDESVKQALEAARAQQRDGAQ